MRHLGIYSILSVISIAACAAEPLEGDKGEESPLPVEGAADSLYSPTRRGPLVVGDNAATLSPSERFPAWTFDIGLGGATVALSTSATPEIDTVLYLYRREPNGKWSDFIARNDNTGAGTKLSALHSRLPAGSYRAIVKGYQANVYGAFTLSFGCEGDGCAAALTLPSSNTCLFGDVYGWGTRGEGSDHGLRTVSERQLRVADEVNALLRAQLFSAVRAATSLHPRSFDEAARASEDGTFTITELAAEDGRSFRAITWRAGVSVGAIHRSDADDVVATIADGTIGDCLEFGTPIAEEERPTAACGRIARAAVTRFLGAVLLPEVRVTRVLRRQSREVGELIRVDTSDDASYTVTTTSEGPTGCEARMILGPNSIVDVSGEIRSRGNGEPREECLDAARAAVSSLEGANGWRGTPTAIGHIADANWVQILRVDVARDGGPAAHSYQVALKLDDPRGCYAMGVGLRAR